MSIDYLQLRNSLSEGNRQRVKTLAATAIDTLPLPWGLELIAWRYGTDKAVHGYMPYYARHFAPFRRRPVNLLEIGIGTYGPRSGGASLRTWQRYFPRARIHGLDIVDKKVHEDRRIKVYQGDQGDQPYLRRLADDIGPLQIIIDDGSHMNHHVLASFEALFPLLEDGGLYVIEDTQTSYLTDMGGSSRDLAKPGTMMNLVKSLCDDVNAMFIVQHMLKPWSNSIDAVHVYRNIVFIEKGDSTRYPVHDYAKVLMRDEQQRHMQEQTATGLARE